MAAVIGAEAGTDAREVELFLRQPSLHFTIDCLVDQFAAWKVMCVVYMHICVYAYLCICIFVYMHICMYACIFMWRV